MAKVIKIGTRGSPLALTQTNIVKEALAAVIKDQDITLEIVPITTSGDKNTNVRLSEIGGKGLFTKELEEALAEGQIDLAVHSMKDVETWIRPEFCIPSMLKREDPRDAWISVKGYTLSTLPQASRVGTSSLRRAAQILHQRPDLTIITFRGNVDTRIEKLKSEEAEATLLAIAGLNRLQRPNIPTIILDPDIMVPAVGQGALGVECLENRQDIIDLLYRINHQETFQCVTLERAFLDEIDGTCGTPVGALATIVNSSEIDFLACVATQDGKSLYRKQLTCSIQQAESEIRNLGKHMHQWLKDNQ
jgi:hydroxymethylbilane synthase